MNAFEIANDLIKAKQHANRDLFRGSNTEYSFTLHTDTGAVTVHIIKWIFYISYSEYKTECTNREFATPADAIAFLNAI